MLESESKERALQILSMSIEAKTIAAAARKFGISGVRAGLICQQIAGEMIGRARDRGVTIPPHDYFSHAERLIYRDFWRRLLAYE